MQKPVIREVVACGRKHCTLTQEVRGVRIWQIVRESLDPLSLSVCIELKGKLVRLTTSLNYEDGKVPSIVQALIDQAYDNGNRSGEELLYSSLKSSMSMHLGKAIASNTYCNTSRELAEFFELQEDWDRHALFAQAKREEAEEQKRQRNKEMLREIAEDVTAGETIVAKRVLFVLEQIKCQVSSRSIQWLRDRNAELIRSNSGRWNIYFTHSYGKGRVPKGVAKALNAFTKWHEQRNRTQDEAGAKEGGKEEAYDPEIDRLFKQPGT
jgi:hypothetical protein